MNNLTVGKPLKVIIKLSIPLFISVIFQQVYSITDSIIVGNFLGQNALAGVGTTFHLTMLLMGFAIGFGVGAGVVVSKLFGSGDNQKVKSAIYTILFSACGLAIAVTLIAYFSGGWQLRLIKTPPEIFNDAKTYLDIYIYGFAFLMIYNVVNAVFTSLGDSMTPLILLIISSVLNIVLDLIFVIVLKMGVSGVAWATFISQALCSTVAVIIMLTKLYKLKCPKFKFFDFSLLKDIVKFSLPSIAQQCLIAGGNIFIQFIINKFGTSVIAGFSVFTKLNAFGIMAITNLANGITSFSAQNFGAHKFDRINSGYKVALIMGLVVSSIVAIIYTAGAGFVSEMFLSKQSIQALTVSKRFLYIVSPFYIIIACKLMSDGLLRGIGRLNKFMISTFLDLILRCVLAYVLSIKLGFMGVVISWPIGWCMGSILSVVFVLSDKKLHFRNIFKKPPQQDVNICQQDGDTE